MEDKIQIKPYSPKELASLYAVSKKVVKHWLSLYSDELGPRVGMYYTIAQVKIIFDRLGKPE